MAVKMAASMGCWTVERMAYSKAEKKDSYLVASLAESMAATTAH